MRNPSPDIRKFVLRVFVIACAGMFAGFLRWGSLIFFPMNMPFQFTQISIAAGLSYALFKHTSTLNSLLVLFCYYLAFTVLEAFNNRWMYVLNLTYTAGIASVVYLYLSLIEKSILKGPIRRIAAITVAIGIVNPLHVVVLVLMSFWLSDLQRPEFISHVLRTCWFNLETGILVGFAVALGIETVDHSTIQRILAEMKSWALDSNGS